MVLDSLLPSRNGSVLLLMSDCHDDALHHRQLLMLHRGQLQPAAQCSLHAMMEGTRCSAVQSRHLLGSMHGVGSERIEPLAERRASESLHCSS